MLCGILIFKCGRCFFSSFRFWLLFFFHSFFCVLSVLGGVLAGALWIGEREGGEQM